MTTKIHFAASEAPEARAALEKLTPHYGNASPDVADFIVALGGDGFMLQSLHKFIESGLPIYGMNFGSVGFLMNEFKQDDLCERLAAAEPARIHPLRMTAYSRTGEQTAIAFNEVSLLRQTRQTAKLRIILDGKTRLEELVCDGILVSTPAGSTAYNLSAHGPILPINASLLAMTPLSPFRPRRWRGALLPHDANIRFDVLNHERRPVSAVADDFEVRHVERIDIAETRKISVTMLFDAGHSLDERILTEQFVY
nr:MAG: NAD kinase [Hyphomicrobiales bacterium]